MPDDYEEIYQQMLSEIQQPDLVVTLGLLTAWGNTPETVSYAVIKTLALNML